jgi:hypothetical protein
MILPFLAACEFAGLGVESCMGYTPCTVWINLYFDYIYLPTIAHELGHNMGLQHSSQGGNQYGDSSCIMASDYPVRFYSAAHQYVSGWSTALADLSAATWPGGVWVTYLLPATATSSSSAVVVQPDASGVAATLHIVSFRAQIGYDSGVPAGWANLVNVHQYSGGTTLYTQTLPSNVAQLDVGQAYTSAAFTVQVLSKVRMGDIQKGGQGADVWGVPHPRPAFTCPRPPPSPPPSSTGCRHLALLVCTGTWPAQPTSRSNRVVGLRSLRRVMSDALGRLVGRAHKPGTTRRDPATTAPVFRAPAPYPNRCSRGPFSPKRAQQ